jgi:hypothetical protein
MSTQFDYILINNIYGYINIIIIQLYAPTHTITDLFYFNLKLF